MIRLLGGSENVIRFGVKTPTTLPQNRLNIAAPRERRLAR